jgi:hypothetical protein
MNSFCAYHFVEISHINQLTKRLPTARFKNNKTGGLQTCIYVSYKLINLKMKISVKTRVHCLQARSSHCPISAQLSLFRCRVTSFPVGDVAPLWHVWVSMALAQPLDDDRFDESARCILGTKINLGITGGTIINYEYFITVIQKKREVIISARNFGLRFKERVKYLSDSANFYSLSN